MCVFSICKLCKTLTFRFFFTVAPFVVVSVCCCYCRGDTGVGINGCGDDDDDDEGGRTSINWRRRLQHFGKIVGKCCFFCGCCCRCWLLLFLLTTTPPHNRTIFSFHIFRRTFFTRLFPFFFCYNSKFHTRTLSIRIHAGLRQHTCCNWGIRYLLSPMCIYFSTVNLFVCICSV